MYACTGRVDFFSRFRLLATFAIAIPLLSLVAILWSLTDSHQSIEQALGEVRQTRTLDENLARVQELVLEAESSQRGFLLTGRPVDLAPFEQATTQLPILLARLKGRARSVPDTQIHIELLDDLVEQRLGQLSQSIGLARLERRAEAIASIDTGRSLEITAAIRRLVDNLRQVKQGELALGRIDLEERLTLDRIAATILAAFDILFLLGIIALLQRVFRLQQIATVCAWSKTIRDGNEWITFEEYLRRKFGMAITHGISREIANRLIAEGREERIELDYGVGSIPQSRAK